MNESNTLTPEILSVLEKELAPIIKAYEMDKPVITAPVFQNYDGFVGITVTVYRVYNKRVTLGTFFTKKKATEFIDLLNKLEINTMLGREAKIATERDNIYGKRLQMLSSNKGLKTNFTGMDRKDFGVFTK